MTLKKQYTKPTHQLTDRARQKADALHLDENKLTSDEPLTKKDLEHIESILKAIESIGLEEFMEYIKSPWKLVLPNLVAGIARGFGAIIGATIVVAVITWSIAQLAVIPLIGSYFGQAQKSIMEYAETTNYNTEFREMSSLLKEIRDELKKQP